MLWSLSMVAKRTTNYLAASSLLMVLAGCAGVPVPTEQVELTRNAVSRAVTADATQYAPAEMKAAQDKLYAVERALGERNLVAARTLAEQAEADANLAERKARAAKAQQQLRSAQQGIEVLKQEMLQSPDAITPTITP
ncbi:chromosome segregation ATPase [Pseudomonas putida]|nr:chromosome segregation ATPase [Pseudomonas putida]OOW00064.1 chromosome segregation ATPase [Pseudomonas sp. MF6396]